MKNSFNGRDFRLVTALAIVSLAAACGEKPKAPPPQPPEVGVYAAKTTPVPVVVELPGRVSAFLAAPIIARVDGIVLHRDFVEGSEVKAGQRRRPPWCRRRRKPIDTKSSWPPTP